MSLSLRFFSLPVLAFALVFSVNGCSKPAATDTDGGAPPVAIGDLEDAHSHGAHSHADNFPDAVAELGKLNDQIAAAFAANKIEDADDAVHEIPHVLEGLPKLAGQAGLGDAAVAEISAAVEKLFAAFDVVDAKIHGGAGKGYDEVQADVDAALTVLRSHLPK